MNKKYLYKAFISYRRLPKDEKIAENLQKKLECYKIPPKTSDDHKYEVDKLEKNSFQILNHKIEMEKSWKKKQWKIFRDETDLPTSGDLSSEILRALQNSEFLILVLSPEFKESEWCMEELRHYKELHHGNTTHIISCIVHGEPNDVFVPELLESKEQIQSEDGEISWISRKVKPFAPLMAAKDGKWNHKQFQKGFLRIAAQLIGCEYDDLVQREKKRKQKNKIKNIIIGAFVILSVVTIIFIVLFINEQKVRKQKEEALLEQQKVIALQAENAFNDGKRLDAIDSIISALKNRNDSDQIAPQMERVLQKITNAYVPEGNGKLIASQELKTERAIARFHVDEYTNGKYVATVEINGNIIFWNSKTGEKIISLEFENAGELTGHHVQDMIGVAFRQDAHAVVFYGNTVVCLNLQVGEVEWKRKYNWHYRGFTFEMKNKRLKDTNELFNFREESYGTNGNYIAMWIPKQSDYYISNETENCSDSIILLDMEDGEQIDVIPVSYEASTIRISNDGRYIAFAERGDGDNIWKGCLFDRISREKTELTKNNPHDITIIEDKILILHSQNEIDSLSHYSPEASIECFSLTSKDKLWERLYSIKYGDFAKKSWIKASSQNWVPDASTEKFFALVNGNEVFLCDLNQGYTNYRASFSSFVKDIYIDLEFQNEKVLYAVLENGELYRYLIERLNGRLFFDGAELDKKFLFEKDVIQANYVNSTYYIVCKEDSIDRSESVGVASNQGMKSFRVLVYRKQGYDDNTQYFKKQVRDFGVVANEGVIIPFKNKFFHIHNFKNDHYSKLSYTNDKYTENTLNSKNNRIDCYDTNSGDISWLSDLDFSISKEGELYFIGVLPQKDLLVLYQQNAESLERWLYFVSTVDGSIILSKKLKRTPIKGKTMDLYDAKPFIYNGSVCVLQSEENNFNILQYNLEKDTFSLLHDAIHHHRSNLVLKEAMPSSDGDTLFCIAESPSETTDKICVKKYGIFINLKNKSCQEMESELLNKQNCYWNGTMMVMNCDDMLVGYSVSGNKEYQIKCNNIASNSWAINGENIFTLAHEEGNVVLYRYSVYTGQFIGKTILFNESSYVDYNRIEVLNSGDNLTMLRVYSNEYYSKICVIDPNNGEMVSCVEGGVSYNKDGKKFLIADKNWNYCYVKRYTFDELVERAELVQRLVQKKGSHIIIEMTNSN